MPLLLWGPMLEVGVKEIDSQHRKLVDRECPVSP